MSRARGFLHPHSTPRGGAGDALRPNPQRRGIAAAVIAGLAILSLPALPAQAATASDILTATTNASPEIGIVKTSTTQYVGVTLKANVAATAITMSLVQPGTVTAYTGAFSFSTNGCSNRSLAVGSTCSSNIRFYSATKGSFAADARYVFTSGGVNYSDVIALRATAGTLPGSPTTLTTNVLSRTSLSIGWTAPADTGGLPLTSTRLNITDTTTGISTDMSLAGNTTSYTAAGLTLGRLYSFRAYVSNVLGESAVALAGSVTFALPAPTAVTNLRGTSRSTSISATWTPSSGYVDGYNIQVFNRGPGGLTTDVATVPANTSSYVITDLLPATQYVVKISAFNTSTSALTTLDISTQRAKPEAPTGLRVTRTTATSAAITWTAPVQDVDGYTIETSTDGRTWDDAGAPDDPTVTTYEISDLEPLTQYFIRISAFNSTDDPDGDISSPITATTQSGFTNPVRNFSASGRDEVSVQMSWQAPLPSYATTVTYRIESRDVTDIGTPSQTATDWETVDEVDADVTSYVAEGLTPCVKPAAADAARPACPTTQYRVISVSDWGDSTPSDTVSASPDFRPVSAVSNITVTPSRPYESLVSWDPASAGSSPIIGYTIFYSSDPADIVCAANDNGGCDVGGDSVDVDSSSTSATLTDLEPGTYYVAVVPRINSQAFGESLGAMAQRVTVAVRGEIEPVGATRVLSVTTYTATIQWDSVATVWNTPTYTVQISSDDGNTWTDAATTTNTNIAVNGLRSGAYYLVQVVAADNFTTADPSDSADFLLPLLSPTSVAVTSTDDSSIDVSWANPDSAALVTGWRLEQQTVTAGAGLLADAWEEVDTVDVATTSYHLADLQPCDVKAAPVGHCPTTHYQVIAVNDEEESTPSANVTGAPHFALPTAPTDITSAKTGAGSVTISWKPATAGSSPTIGYTVFYSTDPADLECATNDFGGCDIAADSIDTDATTTTLTLSDLDPGVTVYAVVAARMTSPVWQDLTSRTSALTAVDVPQQIESAQNLTITTYSFRSATLNWDPSDSNNGPVTYTIQISSDDGDTWTDAATTTDTGVTVPQLIPDTTYQVQILSTDAFSTSEPSEYVEFHTKSRALPSKPSVADFTVDGGGTVTIDPGVDNGATNSVYTVVIVPNFPGGRSLDVTCDQESLECDVPDAATGTGYRILVKVRADGGASSSGWFIYTPPPIELDLTTDDVVTTDSQIDIEAFNLRPGTAFVTYGRQRMRVDVDSDGYASASFNLIGLGRKVVTIYQGSRKASTFVWVVGAKPQQTKRRLHDTAYVKVMGAAPGSVVSIDTSTGEHHEVISTGATITLPVYMSDPDSVDYTIAVNGTDILDGTVDTFGR